MTQAADDRIIGAFSEAQAAQLAGVSVRQLRFWAKSGFFAPTFDRNERSDLPVSLYSFRDLVCLKVIGLLRHSHKIALPELRKAKDRLSHLGSDLWATTTLYVLGRKVVFQDASTGRREEASSGQGVFAEIPLRLVTGELESEARRIRMRDPLTIGRIERKRGVLNNRPIIAGTRVLVDTVIAFREDGYSDSEIIEQFPALTKKDISSALHFKEKA